MGTWYQVGRYGNEFEHNGDCPTISFKKVGGEFVEIADEAENQNNEVIQGVLKYEPGSEGRGRLLYVPEPLTGITFTVRFYLPSSIPHDIIQ